MFHKTRLFSSIALAALVCGAASLSLRAQGPAGGPPPPDGGPGRHHGPPPSLLFDALDTNHDGVISADEISNAAASLKTLLKNGATELTREDLRPPRPAHGPEAAPSPGTGSSDATPATAGSPPPPKTGAENDGPGGRGGPGGHPHHGPPPSPLFEALDANHDGVISAAEIDNAPAALKTLLKSGATQLTRADLRPQHAPPPPEN